MSRAALLALALAFGACRSEGGEGPATPAQAEAAEGARCLEHGVLEAICTKCHPKLIPIFKAKGDWCEEHGFPESVCPLCHPERGGRPAADVTSDDAPPDGTTIRFKTPDVARKAGIEVVKAVASVTTTELEVSARIAYDATRVAQVNARIGAVIEAVLVEVGSRVEEGTALARARSTNLAGEHARLTAARTRVRILRTQLDRKRRLHAEDLLAERELLDAEETWTMAKADLAAFEANLTIIRSSGAFAGSPLEPDGTFVITAPRAGLITHRNVSAGNLAAAEQALFTIVDPSAMWAELDVPEDRLGDIRAGLVVSVRVDAMPERSFEGAIDYVAPEIDPHSRTALVRVPLANLDASLRANMFATATITLSAARSSIQVARAAVQRVKESDMVFVATGPDSFVTRRVKVGASDGVTVTVIEGLAVGEPVVTTGSFLLKTEVMKDSIGAGCCEVD